MDAVVTRIFFFGNTKKKKNKVKNDKLVVFNQVKNYLGPVSRKSRELFGSEKPFVKSRPAYSVKLIFSHVVKGIKIKIMAKFRASRRLRFEDTKRIISPEIRPKSFGTFEKQAPGFESIHPGQRFSMPLCGYISLPRASARLG